MAPTASGGASATVGATASGELSPSLFKVWACVFPLYHRVGSDPVCMTVRVRVSPAIAAAPDRASAIRTTRNLFIPADS